MNRAVVDKLAKAMLYEGYVLYPYRPSVKNSQRWCFGGIYPPAWSQAQTGTDACIMQTECLVSGTGQSRLQIIVRFLHLMDRKVGELISPVDQLPADPEFQAVNSLRLGERSFHNWQEAEEREMDLGQFQLAGLVAQAHEHSFTFYGRKMFEPLRGDGAPITAILIREQQSLRGVVRVSAAQVAEGLFRVSILIRNDSTLEDTSSRDLALMHSLVSTHTILGVESGEFVSQTDPPQQWKAQAANCENIGAWPVLVGDESLRDTILSSPIILYDFPQLAPESPGDLFDSTEIDEILTLRILTLTDDEKRAAAGADQRVGDLLARTEALARDQLRNLHGTLRGMQPVSLEPDHG